MQVIRVFNNNVVLARDELGREAVLTGRGVGFQRKPGHTVDESLVERRYVPSQSAESVGEVIAGIPLERIALIERIFRAALRDLGTSVPSSSVVAVVDHVNQVIERARQGLEMDYPLRAEVAHLHPEELRLAERMIDELNAAGAAGAGIRLPRGEASALALHLFTAAVGARSTHEAVEQSRVLGQVMAVVGESCGPGFNPDSIDAARFATHLRYFLVRARQGVQVSDGTAAVVAGPVAATFPAAATTARRIGELLALRLGLTVSDDELAYLTIHTARLQAASAAGR